MKLRKSEHHYRLSRPNAACRFEHDWFEVDRTGGFVDPKKWLILQFAHPTLVKLDGEDLDDDDIREINFYVKDVMRDLLDSRRMEQFGCSRPLAIWLLKDGYPHSKEKLNSETGKMECEKRPTFVILLEKKSANISQSSKEQEQVKVKNLPPYLWIEQAQRYTDDEDGWLLDQDHPSNWWIKLWWDGRPDLCNYCKEASDGHLIGECGKAQIATTRRAPKPTVY